VTDGRAIKNCSF